VLCRRANGVKIANVTEAFFELTLDDLEGTFEKTSLFEIRRIAPDCGM
jgi:hypothetical protein